MQNIKTEKNEHKLPVKCRQTVKNYVQFTRINVIMVCSSQQVNIIVIIIMNIIIHIIITY